MIIIFAVCLTDIEMYKKNDITTTDTMSYHHIITLGAEILRYRLNQINLMYLDRRLDLKTTLE